MSDLSVAIATDAMLANNDHFIGIFYDSADDALVGKKLMNGFVVHHCQFVAVAAFPKSPVAVLHHLVEKPIARGVASGNPPKAVAADRPKSVPRGSNKHLAILALEEGCDTCGVIGSGEVAYEAVAGVVVAVKPQAGADPEASLAVLIEACDDVATQRGTVSGAVEIALEMITIEAVEAVIGGNPHVAVLILTQVIDEHAGKTLGWNEGSPLSEQRREECLQKKE